MARELAELTGESLTEAISKALRERLERESGRKQTNRFREEIKRIRDRVERLPRMDDRSDEELIGYDSYGLPE